MINIKRNEEKEKKKKRAVIILLFLVLLLCMISSTMAKEEIMEQIKIEKEILEMFLNFPDKEQTIEYGDKYTEFGAVAWYDSRNVSNNIIIDKSELNLNKIGTYTVKYIIKVDDVEKVLERIVKVVDTKPPKITLKGGNQIILITGSSYEEPGFVATDNYDGNITSKVKVSGTIDTNKAGIYYLRYTVIDQSGNKTSIQRKVIVQDVELTQPPVNIPVEPPTEPQVELPVEPPVEPPTEIISYLTIELTGANPIYLEAKVDSYIEPGALAKDNYGNAVYAELEITGTVNPNLIGEYEIIYTAVDKAGNSTIATRTVIVEDTLRTCFISESNSNYFTCK